MEEDEGCYEYLQVMNPNQDSFNEMVYDRLLTAIPNPKEQYCRWVIDQFLMRQFSLNEVEEVRENIKIYLDEISSQLPPYYLDLVEELDKDFYDDSEEEDN